MDEEALQKLTKEELLAWIRCRFGGENAASPLHTEASKESLSSGSVAHSLVPALFADLPFTLYIRPLDLAHPFDWISEHSAQLTGFDPPRFTGEPAFWRGRIHPQDKKRALAVMEGAGEGQVIELEYRFLTADGRWIYLLDRSVGVHGGSVGVSDQKIVGALLDVTHRRELERKVSEISEQEKQKLGRDLHDDLCQQLTCLELLVHSMQRRLDSTKRMEISKLDDLLHHVRKAIVTTQTMARGLSTSGLGDLGLPAALNHWLSKLDTVLPLEIGFKGPKQLQLRDADAAVHIYRIAQEAIQNAIKHSGATKIQVRLEVDDHDLTLMIEDNGFCRGDIHAQSGLGMKTMHYRSSLLNGLLRIDTNVHGGVTVCCEIPFIVQPDGVDQ